MRYSKLTAELQQVPKSPPKSLILVPLARLERATY